MRTVSVERRDDSVVAHLHGDLVVPTAHVLYTSLRALARERDVTRLVVDFSDAGRVDSSAIAAIALVRKQLEHTSVQLELVELDDRHRAAFALAPAPTEPPAPGPAAPGVLERVGDRAYSAGASAAALGALVTEGARQGLAVATRHQRVPSGSIGRQVLQTGVNAVFIVGLLSFLLGMTIAYQGATQLGRLGAEEFVADLIGLSMVREFAPLVTAVILTGRTGAAFAAELGTMKVRSEVDALLAMGINPVRFLVVPRLLAITFAMPALTLIAMYIGMLGGMFVATTTFDMSPLAFWSRMIYQVDLWDYAHGLSKSLVFAWIIGLSGCFLGLRAGPDASSVGSATTRTVVTSVFFIIVFDAVFTTVWTMVRPP